MNFSVEKNEILKTIGLMQSVIEKKKTLPILSNILININDNKSTIEATDLEITLISEFKCNIKKGINNSSSQKIIRHNKRTTQWIYQYRKNWK